ncbi:response regulator transcription factor [Streptomyces spectabilis]|uniref:Response regulator transcription factor n=1 Tax=Streptomyces spectabilis TaxID=68270 RepID=A0A516R885_STRST|nr:response regulator transcription factor [Streptomyces spectabilis]QDQ11872.1 response regulator transcription factor [Streptomyces spectabilis]
MLNVTVAHHHPLIRRGLAQSLADAGEFAVTSYGDVDGVLARVRTRPDSVVLASRSLPGIDRLLDAVRGSEPPRVPVALLGEAAVTRPTVVGVPPGVSGYLPEDADVRALAHAVHTLASGAAVLPAAWIHRTGATTPRAEARDAHGGAPLSLREREVLALLGEGLTNQQIGRRLGLSAGTVKSYISAVYAKCGVDNRVQAALFAHGIEVSAA